MSIVDAIWQPYLIPILRKYQHFLKSDTELYVLPNIKQPNICSWKTFNYDRELHVKGMMLYAWSDFWLSSFENNIKISKKIPQFDIFQMAGWWRAGKIPLFTLN